MSKIMWVCPRCGARNLENKCKECGYEVLPITPKPVMRGKKEKKKRERELKGVYR